MIVSNGTVHEVTPEIRKALLSDPKVLAIWEGLTPLSRNEWICWVNFPKKEETRNDHLKRLVKELNEGVRRPCCWLGCIHRQDKPISPSVKGILEKRFGGKK